MSQCLKVSLVADTQYHHCRQEVEALPLRKQSKWHKIVRDNHGVKHRVCFVNGELVFKGASGWVTLKPLGDAHLYHTSFEDPSDEARFQRLNRAHESGGTLAAREEFARQVEETATGNHKSKPHKISVPTRPGEPVRG